MVEGWKGKEIHLHDDEWKLDFGGKQNEYIQMSNYNFNLIWCYKPTLSQENKEIKHIFKWKIIWLLLLPDKIEAILTYNPIVQGWI